MASLVRITIKDGVIMRDDSEAFHEWFDESTLREVTAIGDWCFGLNEKRAETYLGDGRRRVLETPWALDLSLLVNCKQIGDGFAVGHPGPIMLPPALTTVGHSFMAGVKCRVLELPATLTSIGEHCFTAATADQILLPRHLNSLPEGAFRRARIATLEVPGSVVSIGKDFGSFAIIGSLTFPTDADDRGLLLDGKCLDKATVETIDLKRDVLLRDGSFPVAASAKITLLRHLLPTVWEPPAAEAGQQRPAVRSAFLGNPHNARLFPNSVVTVDENVAPIEDRTMLRPPPEPEAVSAPQVDPATLEVFEDKHRSLVQHGDTIDTRGLVNCRELGEKCFAGLTGVTVLWLPPNLSKISAGFMESAHVPELDIVFPPSLRAVGDMLLHKATVRSVDFTACDGLTTLNSCLVEATIQNFAFPPNIEEIGSQFMQGVNAPHLDLEFPKTVRVLEDILSAAKLRSVNFSFCDTLTIFGAFLWRLLRRRVRH